MSTDDQKPVRNTTIQVPLRTTSVDTAWLAAILPEIARVIFGNDVTWALTAPGRVPAPS